MKLLQLLFFISNKNFVSKLFLMDVIHLRL